MAEVRWIYDLTIFLYAASVLFYFNDFLQSNRKVNRLAFGLLVVVWALQTAFFVSQTIMKAYFPVITLFETLFFYSWVLVSLSLAIHYFFRIDLLVFFTNIIGFVVLVMSMFLPETPIVAVSSILTSELLLTHVTLAMFSYGAFSLSMIFSGMYLLQHKMLKERRWTPLLRRLPSLERLGSYAYRMNMLGVPMLLLSIVLGIIWAKMVLPEKFLLDAKVVLSILVLASYSFWLYKRYRDTMPMRRMQQWNVLAFALLLINFFATNTSTFHSWW
ncbi:cytochrome c biogenesis protein CcsA [Brevibacillus brevis]|uniref:Cytochrome c biogenesis protein CcsA n=1 Tax=Brevibacillus brevis TaxID=1393 RepID=A0ABY9T9B2_BREBE|nr:cytochrome c biogenesis protein CcsA [Brevibacillus brevis]WNC16675.1 cytochrome c biogenesis protein CcsA [Brevibacillus brevis]